MIREFEVGNAQLKERCPVCQKRFKLGERIILCPIQDYIGEGFVNAMALPIHLSCYYIQEDSEGETK